MVNKGQFVGHNSEGNYKKKDGRRYGFISFKINPNKNNKNICSNLEFTKDSLTF